MERKLVLSSIIVILLTSLFGVAFRVEPVQASGTIYFKADGSIDMHSNDLGVVRKFQRKDTKMLCLGHTLHGGCAFGFHPWDDAHLWRGCTHDDSYCVRAAISMINSFFGGHLSQDRISFYVMHERNGNQGPEGDLGHGQGLSPSETYDALAWALNGATPYHQTSKPSFSEIMGWIDSNRPVLRRNVIGPWHATVIDGYEETGQMVHVINPWTKTESSLAYSSLLVREVWVPPAGASARSDESTLNADSDADGVVDFDEIERFGTNPTNADSDGDWILDREEILSYTFDGGVFDSIDSRLPDPDGDGLRCELDWDSDNGGTADGLEDRNRNGKVDPGETDPLDPSDDPLSAVSIRVVGYSSINLLVIDPEGLSVGYDNMTQSIVNEIPGATYSGPGSEPQEISIPNSLNGTYEVLVFGIDSGVYTIEVISLDWNSSIIDYDSWEGIAIPGGLYTEVLSLESDGRLILPHDIEVVGVEPAKTVVGEGYNVLFEMIFENQGNYSETFVATLYANNMTIYTSSNITLLPDNSATMNFAWNTSSTLKGNYSMSAYAFPVAGEIDIIDNIFVAEMEVCVTIPGDIDADRDVDILDVVSIISSYGSAGGSPVYNPNYDIDGDEDVDIFDIVAACGHYGESW